MNFPKNPEKNSVASLKIFKDDFNCWQLKKQQQEKNNNTEVQ